MATQLQKLIAALRGTPAPTMPNIPPNQAQGVPPPAAMPQMGGMTGQAQGILQARPAYLNYMEQVQSQGKQPVSFEQFMQGAR